MLLSLVKSGDAFECIFAKANTVDQSNTRSSSGLRKTIPPVPGRPGGSPFASRRVFLNPAGRFKRLLVGDRTRRTRPNKGNGLPKTNIRLQAQA